MLKMFKVYPNPHQKKKPPQQRTAIQLSNSRSGIIYNFNNTKKNIFILMHCMWIIETL